MLPDLAAEAPIAEQAFDAEERVVEPLTRAGKAAVIPPKANRRNPRPYGRDLYKARHLIEKRSSSRAICRSERFRPISQRHRTRGRSGP